MSRRSEATESPVDKRWRNLKKCRVKRKEACWKNAEKLKMNLEWNGARVYKGLSLSPRRIFPRTSPWHARVTTSLFRTCSSLLFPFNQSARGIPDRSLTPSGTIRDSAMKKKIIMWDIRDTSLDWDGSCQIRFEFRKLEKDIWGLDEKEF